MGSSVGKSPNSATGILLRDAMASITKAKSASSDCQFVQFDVMNQHDQLNLAIVLEKVVGAKNNLHYSNINNRCR